MAHPDNTIKALRGEETFVERWQCRFGWHRWAKWSPLKYSADGMFTSQTRECVDCGLTQVKKGNA